MNISNKEGFGMKKILLLLAIGFEAAGFYEEAFSEPFQRVSRYFDLHQKPIASVCVASLTVAQSGVLQNRKAYNL